MMDPLDINALILMVVAAIVAMLINLILPKNGPDNGNQG